ncbi:MAG: hypothetical protein SFW35_08970 [Chitinophagales bacterium]|nr:hypothetical protein [Chitinophagales bacterium]
MKNKITLLMMVGLLMGLSACNKCVTCDDGFDSETVCKSDFAGNGLLYRTYVEALEDIGYECE